MFEGFIGILAFFATILALVTGMIVIGIALLSHQAKRAGKVGLILLGWLGLYALILLAASFTSRPHYLDLSQERCFDEMCYSVKSVTVTHTLINTERAQIQARGNYYVVTVSLRNAGRGTPQKPSYPSLVIVDGQGKIYTHFINITYDWGVPDNLPNLPIPLWGGKIQPGQAVSQTVAFDLPVDIRQPGLVVSEGVGPLSAVLIGDENSFFHAKTEFLLTP